MLLIDVGILTLMSIIFTGFNDLSMKVIFIWTILIFMSS